jgi:hypothetical protein
MERGNGAVLYKGTAFLHPFRRWKWGEAGGAGLDIFALQQLFVKKGFFFGGR